VVSALRDSLSEERSAAGAMMAELLCRILTPVQAARYLLAGHPFAWNGLTFAHAVAAMQQRSGGVKQEPAGQLTACHT
jgi:hypothetical protein